MEERLHQERLRDEENMVRVSKYASRMITRLSSYRQRTTLSKDLEITAQEVTMHCHFHA